ncbi:MAG: acyltransferase family protein [Bacteroidales bacterium]|nr:acyltransferase family protein [Bacteroidales bacterium]
MGRFFCVNASFFMGLFFMISGYFFASSFNKKGLKKYTADKFIRYGIPLVFVFWIMMPFIFYFNYELYSDNPSLPFLTFFQKIYLGIGQQPEWFKPILTWPESDLGFGHLWFVENLLLYAMLYAVLRVILRKTSFANKFNLNVYLFSFIYILVVATASILVRNYYQVGDIKNVFGFLMIEVAHWPQYLGFLISGIIASQTNLFQKFPSIYGKILFSIGLLMVAKIYFPSFFPDFINFWSGQYFEVFETILGFSLSFGLIVIFRDYLNLSNTLFNIMSENAYAAYIFHYPIVIAFQYSFDKVPINLLAKFLIVGILSIITSFTFSYMIRKPELIRRVV